MNKVLILATVSSMIEQFNMPNILLLKKLKYEVHLAANFKSGNSISSERIKEFLEELEKLNLKVHHIDFSRKVNDIKGHYKSYNQLKNVFKNNSFEFIHCHTPIGGVFGRVFGKKYSVPVIYTAHGFHFFKDSPLINWIIYFPIEWYLSKYTDFLITINKEDYENAKRYKFLSKRIILLNGVGIDLEKFTPQTIERKNKIREELGYKESDFIVICVGELNKTKNQYDAIYSINLLKNDIPNLKLLLVGKGVLKDKYVESVKKLNLNNFVDFLGYRKDISSLMTMADIAITTSIREGLPVNVLEAMAIGLPIVASNCRGNRDLIENHRNGFVFNSHDIKDLSDKIKQLYESSELRYQFSKSNLSDVVKYDINNVILNQKDIYLEILKNRRN